MMYSKIKKKKNGFSVVELLISSFVFSVVILLIAKFSIDLTTTTKTVDDLVNFKNDINIAKMKLSKLLENTYIVFPSASNTSVSNVFLPCTSLTDSALPIYPCTSGGNETNRYYLSGYDDTSLNRFLKYQDLDDRPSFLKAGSVLHFLTVENVDINTLISGDGYESSNRLGPDSLSDLNGDPGRTFFVRILTDNVLYLRKMKDKDGTDIDKRELVLKYKKRWYLAKEDPSNLGNFVPDAVVSEAKRQAFVGAIVSAGVTQYDIIMKNAAFRLAKRGFAPWAEAVLPKSSSDTNSLACPSNSNFSRVDISNLTETTLYSQTNCTRSPIFVNSSNVLVNFIDENKISLPQGTGLGWAIDKTSSSISSEISDVLSSKYTENIILRDISNDSTKNVLFDKAKSLFPNGNQSDRFPDGVGFVLQVSLPRTVTGMVSNKDVLLPVTSLQKDFFINGVKMILSVSRTPTSAKDRPFKFSSIYQFDFKSNRLVTN